MYISLNMTFNGKLILHNMHKLPLLTIFPLFCTMDMKIKDFI